MRKTVDITLPVEPETAAVLANPAVLARAAAEVDRIARDHAVKMLARAMDELGAIAEARGLTQDILDEELAAHKAERRTGPDRRAG